MIETCSQNGSRFISDRLHLLLVTLWSSHEINTCKHFDLSTPRKPSRSWSKLPFSILPCPTRPKYLGLFENRLPLNPLLNCGYNKFYIPIKDDQFAGYPILRHHLIPFRSFIQHCYDSYEAPTCSITAPPVSFQGFGLIPGQLLEFRMAILGIPLP